MKSKSLFHRAAFHTSEKPRGWVRKLIFKADASPRPWARRLVFKKNGHVRQEFAVWMLLRGGVGSAPINVPDTIETPKEDDQQFSAALRTLINLQPLEERVKHWILKAVPKTQLTSDDVLTALQAISAKGLVLSFGHDNYKTVPGGIQLCIAREEQAVTKSGHRYLNIRPYQPLPRLAHYEDHPNPWLELTLNGKAIGSVRSDDLTTAVACWTTAESAPAIVIHHLLGHNPENVSALIQAAGAQRCYFWLHDFFTLCTSYTLQRNDIKFCSAPELSSNSCSLCVYGEERLPHLERLKHLFEEFDFVILSPSDVTLKFWTDRTILRSIQTKVVPHMELHWTVSSEPGKVASTNVVNVGFLGTLAPHKGWAVFEHLAADQTLMSKFRFYALTASKSVPPSMTHVPVKASGDSFDAMSIAVARNEIDVVIHWPTWPETFSLTTHEALLGGAFVITNSISGNVAAAVSKLERGVVLNSEMELVDFFRRGDVEELVQASRRSRRRFQATATLSEMTTPFLLKELAA